MKHSAQLSPVYVAGFMDGEACMRIYRSRSKTSGICIRVEIAIFNTNLEVLELIQASYGGSIRSRLNPHRRIYNLCWSNLESIREFLPKVTPFLVIKKHHAELILKYLTAHTTNTRKKRNESDWHFVEQSTLLNTSLRYRSEPLLL